MHQTQKVEAYLLIVDNLSKGGIFGDKPYLGIIGIARTYKW
jgi:hypothetical protein